MYRNLTKYSFCCYNCRKLKIDIESGCHDMWRVATRLDIADLVYIGPEPVVHLKGCGRALGRGASEYPKNEPFNSSLKLFDGHSMVSLEIRYFFYSYVQISKKDYGG